MNSLKLDIQNKLSLILLLILELKNKTKIYEKANCLASLLAPKLYH